MNAPVSDQEKLRKARIRSHRWYHTHKHEIKEKVCDRSARYYHANKHRIKLTPSQKKHKLAWQQEWRSKNPDKMRVYDLRSRKNVQRSIKQRLRSRITRVLKRNKIRKTEKTIELIGCTWVDFKIHIESLFHEGMSWETRSLWHIDHIKPCSKFDLTDILQRNQCFHYTKMQPMWAEDNLSKHSKWQEAA